MSRIRIVKGNITKIIGGNYKRYSHSDIENIGEKVIQVGKEDGVCYGKAEEPSEAEIKPKKIKFRPHKILPSQNVIAVVEKIENSLKEGDVISISGKEIKDNWISINGKLYLIPKNVLLYGTTFFKVNGDLYQSLEKISNCKSAQDYINSMNEQMEILKELIHDIESSNLKYRDHVKDRLSYDAYYRFYQCVNDIEGQFIESSEYEEVKEWINNNFKE